MEIITLSDLNFTPHLFKNHTNMFKIAMLALSCSFALFASCGTSPANGSTPSVRDTTKPAVEARKPNTDYKPAFAGRPGLQA